MVYTSIYLTSGKTPGEFKDAVLDNLWVVTKNAAQLFDNIYRDYTFDIAGDLGHTFSLLMKRLDRDEKIPEHLWQALHALWQAANTVVAGYQSIRVGFPSEAVVIVRHALEVHALALKLLLDPHAVKSFSKGKLRGPACVTAAKEIHPQFGQQYGLLSKIAHPSHGSVGTHLHQQKDGRIVLLVGAGLPDGSPRLVRNSLTRIVISLIEQHSVTIHASAELMCFDLAEEHHYWEKTDKGFGRKLSSTILKRWAARSAEIMALLQEHQKEQMPVSTI